MADKVWYYTLDGSEKFGPYTDEDFIKLIQQDIVTPEHYIWMPYFENWMKLGDTVYASYSPRKEEEAQTEEGTAEAGQEPAAQPAAAAEPEDSTEDSEEQTD